MATWFTADTHFNHSKIIQMAERPYNTVETMNNNIIDNWNSRINDRDWVFVLGDFLFSKTAHDLNTVLNRLQGHIIPVTGNHDLWSGWTRNTKSTYIQMGNQKILLIHDPFQIPEYTVPDLDMVFCGHVHKAWQFKYMFGFLCVNVGVDVWDYHPRSFNEIQRGIARWKKNSPSDRQRSVEASE